MQIWVNISLYLFGGGKCLRKRKKRKTTGNCKTKD
jgi:hypothetical protein